MSVMKSSFRDYVNMFEFETELPGSGDKITFKPVTTGQIKRLLLYETSSENDSIEEALDELITECVVDPKDFDVKKLYLQDRFYLLVDIRKATRGATYNFQTTCASCSSQTQQILDISKLVVTKLNKGRMAPVEVVEKKKVPVKKAKIVEKTEQEPEVPEVKVDSAPVPQWDVVRLNENISVRLHLITREMQLKAFEIFEKNHPDGASDTQKAIELSTLIQALSIVSIITPRGEESELPLEERIFFLDNIRQEELEMIIKWFDSNDFGVDFSFDVSCSQCGYTEHKAVPVENFFY